MAVAREAGSLEDGMRDVIQDDTTCPIVRSHCSSRMETQKFKNIWLIEQFSVLQEIHGVGESIESARFGDANYEFSLKLFPTGKDEDCAGFLSLFLHIVKCPKQRLQFRVNFTLETLDGPRGCALNKNVVTINKNGIVTASKFCNTVLVKDRAARYLPNDVLTLGAELTVYGDISSVKTEVDDDYDLCSEERRFSQVYNLTTEKSRLSIYDLPGSSDRSSRFLNISSNESEASLEWMFNSGEFSDFTVNVGSQVFRVHRNILASRSKYFAAMLKPGLKEYETSVVNISDVEPNIAEAILRYMYTLKIEDMDELNSAMMIVADRWMMEGLKQKYATLFSKGISVCNVCSRIELAEDLNMDKLFKKLLYFFTKNKNEIIATESWKSIKASNPVLAAKVIEEAWSLVDDYKVIPTKRIKKE